MIPLAEIYNNDIGSYVGLCESSLLEPLFQSLNYKGASFGCSVCSHLPNGWGIAVVYHHEHAALATGPEGIVTFDMTYSGAPAMSWTTAVDVCESLGKKLPSIQ